MKIDFSQTLITVEGTPLKDETGKEIKASAALAGLLSQQRDGNPLKNFNLAREVSKNSTLEVDLTDYDAIKKIVEAPQQQISLIAGQLVEIMMDAKEAHDKKEAAIKEKASGKDK